MKNLDYGGLLNGTQLQDHYAKDHTYPGKMNTTTTMFAPHCHPHYEVLYVYENERIITFERKKCILNKNTICFIPPHTMHKVQPVNDMPQKRILLEFTKEYIEKYVQPLIIDPLEKLGHNAIVLNVPDKDVPKLREMFDELTSLSGKYDDYSVQMFALCTLQLLTFCAEKQSPIVEANKSDVVDDIIRYLEIHYHEDITLDLLAEEFNVSKYKISRSFTKSAGMTLLQHLTRVRIENAKRLLENHTLSITNVGTHTGFRSSSDFARVFKSVTGMTPSQYRKIHLSTDKE